MWQSLGFAVERSCESDLADVIRFVIGVALYLCLLDRSALAIFSKCFSLRYIHERKYVRIGSSVQKELKVVRGVIALVHADLGSLVSLSVFSSDAEGDDDADSPDKGGIAVGWARPVDYEKHVILASLSPRAE